jgi:hypothetical protein
VFAVDVTTWPRCDAECSPERGYYYHPSRHSAGQPIVAGWAYQWGCQLSFDRDSWTAPVDAQRLHPLDDTDQTAAAQVRALLGRLPAGGPVPLVVFDAGYDSAQLTLDLAEAPVGVLVRLRADRCFYRDPPPHQRARPVGHAATAPSSTASTRRPGPSRPAPWSARTTRCCATASLVMGAALLLVMCVGCVGGLGVGMGVVAPGRGGAHGRDRGRGHRVRVLGVVSRR